jgi:hypothetical protein
LQGFSALSSAWLAGRSEFVWRELFRWRRPSSGSDHPGVRRLQSDADCLQRDADGLQLEKTLQVFSLLCMEKTCYVCHCTVISGCIVEAVETLHKDPQLCDLTLTDQSYGNNSDSFGAINGDVAPLYCELLVRCVRPGGYVVLITCTTAASAGAWEAEVRRALKLAVQPLPELLFQGDDLIAKLERLHGVGRRTIFLP